MAKAKASPPKKKLLALARPGDPLVLSDGTTIQEEPHAGSLEDEIKKNKQVNPRTFRASKRRSLKDLPADQGTMNGISLVIMYSVLGVGDREIADALKITPEKLKQVRAHAAYPETFQLVVAEVINANSDLIAARIASYAGSAVDNIFGIAETGKKEETRLRANIDLANRGGINPKDQMQRQSGSMDTLRIQILKGDDEGVTIDINPREEV